MEKANSETPLLGGAAGRELTANQLGIEAAAREQLGMVPGLDQAAGLKHRDQFGIAHSRQAVRDHNGGAIAHQLDERVAHLRLADGVEMRGGLVEDQHRRVFEERARDGDALPLAAGQLHAALAYAGVEPRRQRGDELAERRALEGLHDLGFAGARFSERDVGARGYR